jgi:hypothetical protein
MSSWRSLAGHSVAFALVLSIAVPVCAQNRDTEIREFSVLVSGKPAGEYQLAYEPIDAQSFRVTVKANVQFKVKYVYNYQYTLNNTELWRNGRLVTYEGVTVDDGKKTTLSASFAENRARVVLNGKDKPGASPFMWATTYTCLPDHIPGEKALPLLDIDNGDTKVGQIKFIETKNRPLGAGQPQPCNHFQVTGALPIDVWFDINGRLVQQNFVDEGYVTEIQLKTVKIVQPQPPVREALKPGVRPR